jgi:hypothetical protein
MRTRRPLVTLLLAASLLAGQWLASGHDPDHGLVAGAAHACAVCAYVHGAGAGVLPAVPGVLLPIFSEAPESHHAATPLAAIAADHPIRGPPQLL